MRYTDHHVMSLGGCTSYRQACRRGLAWKVTVPVGVHLSPIFRAWAFDFKLKNGVVLASLSDQHANVAYIYSHGDGALTIGSCSIRRGQDRVECIRTRLK